MTWSPTRQSCATCDDTMKRQRLPMRVVIPPASVPGLIDANSRTTLPSPISRVLGSPRYLRSCGAAPTLANWKMRLPAPIRVRPLITACGPTQESGPSRTCGPTTAYASTVTPGPSSAPRATEAVGWTRGPPGGAAAKRLLRARDAAQPPARPAGETGHLEPERVPGQHRSAEACLLDRHQADVAPRDVAAELHQRLAQHDAREDGCAREVPGEVRLVRADALGADRPHPGLHLEHAIDERPREPVRAPLRFLERDGDPTPCPCRAARRRPCAGRRCAASRSRP